MGRREDGDEGPHPVPSISDLRGLGVERVVPRSDDQLEPSLSSDGQVDLPESLREVGLGREVFLGDFVPATRHKVVSAVEPSDCTKGNKDDAPSKSSVRRHLDSLDPSTASRVRPPRAVDETVVDLDALGGGEEQGGGDWHVLDGKSLGVIGVVLSDLRVEVEVWAGRGSPVSVLAESQKDAKD